MEATQAGYLRILSLDGGGVKGYTSLLILKRIFRMMAKGKEIPKPCEIFDLIVGTSTGGLIAIMLGRLHMTIDECLREYEKIGKEVFGRPLWTGRAAMVVKGFVSRPLYDIATLQQEIKRLLERRGIDTEESFNENKKPLCKVMVCVTRKKISKPDVLRNYISSHPTEENYDCTIWEAASATAAAPIYFKEVTFQKGGERWCDGGLHRNNPIQEALTEIGREDVWKDQSLGCVLSLGTGVPKLQNVSNNLAGFLQNSVDIMIDAENTAETFSKSLRGENLECYFRFSVPQGLQELKLDEYKEIESMKAITTNYLNNTKSGQDIEQCAKFLLHLRGDLQQSVPVRPSLLLSRPCLQFVNRNSYSDKLEAFFKPNNLEQQRFVLWGLGGVGKTQIALQFAHSIERRLSVFWVRADRFQNFVNDFSRILHVLGGSNNEDEQPRDQIENVERISRKLEADNKTWLLVLDNADDFDEFVGDGSAKRNAIQKYIPKKGRILLTTRDPRFAGNFVLPEDSIKVLPMNIQEASSLLSRSVPPHLMRESPDSLITELLQCLGNHPLAIVQAAANISESQMPLKDYVAAYRSMEHRSVLMQQSARDVQNDDPRTSVQSILVTWELSFERLKNKYPLTLDCLCSMGFFHWHKIPEYLLRKLPDFDKMDDISFREVIKPLFHLSMIEQASENEFSIHPVVHERISARLSSPDKLKYLTQDLEIMATVFPLLDAFGNLNASEVISGRYLQPHAIMQLECSRKLGIETESILQLWKYVARYLVISGMTRNSVFYAKQAVEMGRKMYSPYELSNFYARRDYIFCLIEDAQFPEARDAADLALHDLIEAYSIGLFDKTDKMIRELHDEILNLKTSSAINIGLNEEALQLCRELSANSTDLSEDSWSAKIARYNSAVALYELSKLDDAEIAINKHLTSFPSDGARDDWDNHHYLKSLNLKVFILQAIRRSDEHRTTRVLTMREEEEVFQIAKQVYLKYEARRNLRDEFFWWAARNLVQELTLRESYVEAASLLENILKEVTETQFQMEGTLLFSFSWTVQVAFRILYKFLCIADQDLVIRAFHIQGLIVEAAGSVGSSLYDLLQMSVSFNDFGLFLQCRGDFEYAEKMHRAALEALKPDSSGCAEGGILYNLMLAIARHGRVEEALAFREQNIAKIQRVEARWGDMQSRMDKFQADKEVYEKTKSLIETGQGAIRDSWWTEHEDALRRTQIMYGFLEPQNAGKGKQAKKHRDSTNHKSEKKHRRGKIAKLGQRLLSS